jgi:quinol monooxygenase YgiN
VIRKTARFRVRREELDRALAAIRAFVAEVRQEPGTLLYVSLQEKEEPTRFLHYFEFRDRAAEDAHANSEAVKRFTAVLYPLCVEPVAFTDFSTVATTESQPS